MINTERTPSHIESLETQAIKNYIDASVAFLNDPESSQKPEKPSPYRTSDLLQAFNSCFYSKYYLTEQKFANSWAMDVEHFVPQNERPDLAYTWSNLLPAEHKANMMKPRNTPSGGYLDPCNPDDDVENDILYSLSIYGEEPEFEARDSNCTKSTNTASLLDRLHNGNDDMSNKNTANIRLMIRKKYNNILLKIIKWQRQIPDSQEEFQARRELRELLSRESSFTMLCRSIPAVRDLPNEFFD